MADYTASFHMPEFSDKEFLDRKSQYVAQHGYSITLPRFSDVVHVGMHRPMTNQEKVLWYSGRRGEIGRARQIELEYQKIRAKERYEKMLASPIPNFINSITSVLTAIDDAQDAIISLAALGRIACWFLPRVIANVLAWPVGLLWLLATILGLLAGPAACALNPMACKRYMRLKAGMRAKTLKGKARTMGKRAEAAAKYELARLEAGLKGYATSGSFLPSFSEGIQMLQVTNDIWGYGVSIGPVFGAAYDLATGGIRWAIGEKVTFKNSPSDIEVYRKASDNLHNYARYTRPKTKMSKSEFIAWKDKKVREGTWGIKSLQQDAVYQARRLHEVGYGIPHRTDWAEETLFYTNFELACQGTQTCLDYWDPIVNIEGLEHIQIEAYNNPHPLIEEMLREQGINPDLGIGWPTLGKRWATYEELQTTIAPVASENIDYFSENCTDERFLAIAENSATNAGLLAIASMIGREFIELRPHAAIQVAETLLDNNYSFPTTITNDQAIDFMLWTQEHDDNNSSPSLREILSYAKNCLGFEFITV